jgi:uncharacterized membrane protein YccC
MVWWMLAMEIIGCVAGIAVAMLVLAPWLERRHDRTCPDPMAIHGRPRPRG